MLYKDIVLNFIFLHLRVYALFVLQSLRYLIRDSFMLCYGLCSGKCIVLVYVYHRWILVAWFSWWRRDGGYSGLSHLTCGLYYLRCSWFVLSVVFRDAEHQDELAQELRAHHRHWTAARLAASHRDRPTSLHTRGWQSTIHRLISFV